MRLYCYMTFYFRQGGRYGRDDHVLDGEVQRGPERDPGDGGAGAAVPHQVEGLVSHQQHLGVREIHRQVT